ncbi:hypothetical protein PF004_g32445, partial [Phytophthora fragariae]
QGHAASVPSYQTPYPLVAPVPSYQAPDVYTAPASSPPPLVARNLTAELVSVSRDPPNQPRVIDSQVRKAGQGDREGQAVVRQLRVHTRTNKADRIKCLRHYDRLVNSGERHDQSAHRDNGEKL